MPTKSLPPLVAKTATIDDFGVVDLQRGPRDARDHTARHAPTPRSYLGN